MTVENLRFEIDYARVLRSRLRTVTNSYDNLARLTHGSQPVINTGLYQPFKHPHVMRSPPIGVEKLSEVFMNVWVRSFSFPWSSPVCGGGFFQDERG